MQKSKDGNEEKNRYMSLTEEHSLTRKANFNQEMRLPLNFKTLQVKYAFLIMHWGWFQLDVYFLLHNIV